MREIKFRAWHPKEGKMWDDVGTDGCGVVILDTKHMGLKPLKGESIIMQYTGLKDKNGKEIYEGDIVKSTRFNWKEPGHSKHGTNLVTIYRIYWNEERYGFWRTMKFLGGGGMSGGLGFGDDRADRTEIEVIGNICENPELVTDGVKD